MSGAPGQQQTSTAANTQLVAAEQARNRLLGELISAIKALTVSGPTYTVATLPASPADGQKAYVTDANSTTFHAAAVGGSTNHVPVWWDSAGATWRIG